MYISGLKVMEAVQLRVKEFDFLANTYAKKSNSTR